MHRSGLLTLLFSMGFLCHAQQGTGSTAPALVPELSPDDLKGLLGGQRVFVFDCNEQENYVEGHVPGATLVVYDKLEPAELPKDKDATLVFYCYSPECPAAGLAARSVVSMGYTHVYCMPAGITGWQDAGLPTEP